jgi:hypothetical protein
MTVILMSSSDHGGFGRPSPRRERNAGRQEDLGVDGEKGVPPATPERPKSWLGRIIEAMSKPIEPNFDNP